MDFLSIPRRPELREKWLRIINRPHWTPNKQSKVCSKHFEEKCFIQRNRYRILMKDTIPTLFIPVSIFRVSDRNKRI